jgi:molybdopterin-guanine dinucleotide biosynthesis protein A
MQWQAKLFPLPGIYLKSWLPAVSKALMEGRRSITAFANEMGAKLVDAETLNGFHDDILCNFNSPEDLQSYFEQKQRASKR